MATLEPPARASRLPSLTGMRFVAAFAVMISHLDSQIVGKFHPDPPFRVITTLGPVGVTFFFVLSGFILTWVADPNDTPKLFWRRRLVKLYPNQLVTFAASRVLMVAASVPIVAINTIPGLLLIEPWIPYLDYHGGFNGTNSVSWSLGCELFFYLCFPWLIRCIARIRPERLWWWVAAFVAAGTAVPFIAQLLPSHPVTGWDPQSSEWQSWFAYLFPPVRMLEFVLGILMARVVITGKWIRFGLLPASLLTIASVEIQSLLPNVFHLRSGLTAIAIALLIAAAATADTRALRTPFNSRIMVWLGEISFALYMVHYLVIYYGPADLIHATGVVTGSVPTRLLNIFLSIVISIALAAALYHLVERPMVRRFSRPKSARNSVAPKTLVP
ncbi:acyltransferase [Streptomyces sp. NPDC047072]|uniref:acyltransferase family protein n=1 Tax=Streptomyces sp. NPDC047072 TaxID=3154809 RepID=UPI0033CD3A61